MNILLKSKKVVETHFAKKCVIQPNLMNMVNQGEKAYQVSAGTLDGGFSVTLGFFKAKVRYVGFKKRSSSKWEEADLRSCLQAIGPWQFWSSEPGSQFVDYTEENEAHKIIRATGWYTPQKKCVFIYVPTHVNDVILIPDRRSIDLKLSN